MAEQEDLSGNPLYNRELLKTLMGRGPFEQEPAPVTAPEAKGEVSVEPVTPTPPRRPTDIAPPAAPSVAKDEAQAKEAYEKMTQPRFPEILGGGAIPPEAIAGAAGYGETLAPGVFPRIVGGLAKGAGALGIPGYERFAEKPYGEVTEEVKKVGAEAREKAPISGALGTAAGLGAGMATLPVLAAERGPAVSGALTGGLYGAIAEGADEGTIGGAVKGMLVGAGLGGTLAPVAERMASGLTRLAFGGKPVVDASGNLTEEAVRIASEAGLTADQITQLTPQLRQTFEQRGLTKEAAREAPFREFGIEPKRGMVGEDAEQLKREAQFGEYGPMAEQAKTAAEKIAFGGAEPIGIREAIDSAVSKGQENAAKLKSQYESAYTVAQEAPGKFTKESITNVGDRLMQGLAADKNAQHLYHEPFVQQAAAQLNKSLGQSIEGPGGVRILWQNFPAVEGARKGLNSALSQAKTQTEKAGIRRLIEDFDSHVESKLLDGSFSGDPKVVEDWRKARKLFADYQSKYGVKKTGEDAGRLMSDILQTNRNSDDIANMMFTFAGSGDVKAKTSAMKVFNQLRRALGPESDELNNIKGAFVQKLMTSGLEKGEKVTPKNFADTAKQIDAFLKGSGAGFARNVLTDAERATLARYADVMRMAAKKPENFTPESLTPLGQFMWAAAPHLASGVTQALGMMNPKLAMAVAVPMGLASRYAAVKGSEAMGRSMANLPPESLPRSYRFPEFRPLIPLGEAAREREGRATGGRIPKAMTAQGLIGAVEAAKKRNQETTKKILSAPDESVVQALKVANEHI